METNVLVISMAFKRSDCARRLTSVQDVLFKETNYKICQISRLGILLT